MKNAVIVIPTYNESGNIEKLLDNLNQQIELIQNWSVHILIVDSSSPDNTANIVKQMMKDHQHIHLIETKKEGLGKAYIGGFRYALEHLNPFVLFEMDADLSHDPSRIPLFLEKIAKGADFVIGSRYIPQGSIPSDWGLDRKIFSIGANLFVRFGFMKLAVTDWTSGFRAIKTWVVKNALGHVSSYSGYVFQVALLDKALSDGARVAEVPIQFKDRKQGVSKINSIQYILQTFFYVLTHSSFIKFVIVGLLGFVVDFSFAYLFISALHIPKAQANMLSAEIAIVFNFLINNFWSFRHKRIQGGIVAYIGKFLLFNLVSLGSVLIQGGGIFIMLKVAGDKKFSIFTASVQSWILYKIGIIACIIIPYSYVLYNRVIWKKK